MFNVLWQNTVPMPMIACYLTINGNRVQTLAIDSNRTKRIIIIV